MPGRNASPEDGEVDHIDHSINDEDRMDVDDDERVREESSLFLPNSATPPASPREIVDLTTNDDEPPRERSETSLFVRDEPEEASPIDDGSDDDDDGSNDDGDGSNNIDSDADNETDNDTDNEDNEVDMDIDNENNNDNEMDIDIDNNDIDNGSNDNNENNDNDDDDNDDDDDDTDDNADDDDEDNDGGVPSSQKNPDATVEEALEEEGITEPNWSEGCLTTCKPHCDAVVSVCLRYRKRFLLKWTELRETKVRYRLRSRAYKAQIRELQSRLRGQQRRPHRKSWHNVVRGWFCADRVTLGIQDWGGVYKLACKEENMSWSFSARNPPKTHPGLKLRAPDDEEEEEEIMTIPDDDEEESSTSGSDRRSSSDQPPPPGGLPRSVLERLPIKVQIKIFSHLFVFEGELVHAISRLDPYYEPSGPPVNYKGRVSLLNRFHVGEESVSLTFGTIKPQELLAPLLVSKHFNYLGASIFYGCNTFAFSSIGELQHLQHIEILYMGSQALVYKRDDKNRYTSRRAHVLAWLSEARRLKSIAVHLPESSKSYMRRRHEPPHIIEYMAEKTARQPNYRRFRSLRALPGLDYLHVLRGLNGITFWDYEKWLALRRKLPVRDWTFVSDLNKVVRRDKAPGDMRFCRLRRLAPFVIGYRPHDDIITEMEAFVNQYSSGSGGQVVDLTMDDDDDE
ncbi:hypothetical protein N0V84_003203 [Fusarium piperis]|uniref:Uncharacterized protein n=1 Tax=Fusarium piperis TaxID=1435070 RepID=A0A9W9BSM9_9HYPO|nr:hypothetical protein N0V84_003203 [Fusarium piperis]